MSPGIQPIAARLETEDLPWERPSYRLPRRKRTTISVCGEPPELLTEGSLGCFQRHLGSFPTRGFAFDTRLALQQRQPLSDNAASGLGRQCGTTIKFRTSSPGFRYSSVYPFTTPQGY